MTGPTRRACDPEAIAQAAAILAEGGLVGLPTETVYGLACDATNPEAIARAYAAKNRPRFNPLIIHVADVAAAEALGVFPPPAAALAQRFWPGPLTLVLKRRDAAPIAALAVAGLDTIALRVPSHPAMRAVIAALGRPLAAPSANRSGRLSPTAAAHVAEAFGPEVALVLDGGSSLHGVESTVVAAYEAPLRLLRAGAIARADIEAVTGPLGGAPPKGDAARSPGLLATHYAPARARLRLNATAPEPGEAFLGFGPVGWATLNLSPRGDLVEAAARLFAALRALDEAGYDRIAVAPIPNEGLGEAICDRLTRAAE